MSDAPSSAARSQPRQWVDNAVRLIEADARRSADTHLLRYPLPSAWCDGVDVALYLKDESTHITGSLKHRLARSLFLYALCNGWIGENTTVIEASSGSTAVSEAYFAALLGLPFIAVMPSSTIVQGERELFALAEFARDRQRRLARLDSSGSVSSAVDVRHHDVPEGPRLGGAVTDPARHDDELFREPTSQRRVELRGRPSSTGARCSSGGQLHGLVASRHGLGLHLLVVRDRVVVAPSSSSALPRRSYIDPGGATARRSGAPRPSPCGSGPRLRRSRRAAPPRLRPSPRR